MSGPVHEPDAVAPSGATTTASDAVAQAMTASAGARPSAPAVVPRAHLSIGQRQDRGRLARAEVCLTWIPQNP
jgi:hypothetical protein